MAKKDAWRGVGDVVAVLAHRNSGVSWLRSYLDWMPLWLGLRGHRARPFGRCVDCHKINCLAAHRHCIPF
jgi:hypothetical protein